MDANTVLRLTMPGRIRYVQPVDDPMFSAHRKINITLQAGPKEEYMSDFPGTMEGCVQQVSHMSQRDGLS